MGEKITRSSTLVCRECTKRRLSRRYSRERNYSSGEKEGEIKEKRPPQVRHGDGEAPPIVKRPSFTTLFSRRVQKSVTSRYKSKDTQTARELAAG